MVSLSNHAVFAAFAFSVVIGCGKKGPPLPPLVKLPVPPADLVAERRGDTVDLQFTVPSTNTDGTRPANMSRAEVYAITARKTVPPLTDEQLLKLGTRVGSVTVKAPKDPDVTAEADDPADEVDPPEGPGLDQGAIARVAESLTEDMLQPVDLPKDSKRSKGQIPSDDTPRPLLAPSPTVLSRTYAALGASPRGRKGPLSRRIDVPLIPPPSPPSAPVIAYDERAVTVTWTPVAPGASVQAADTADVLPSRPIGVTMPAIGYNVYDVTIPKAAVKLTMTPITASRFSDARIVWGENRCYVVRAAATVGGSTIESDATPRLCETLTDTFPPTAPKELKAVPSEGAITLIWEPNEEKDLAGYIVMRGVATGEAIEPITPSPIPETALTDAVRAGVPYVYVVKAVDKAGNASPPSIRVVESARE